MTERTLYMALVASALTLGACGGEAEPTTEPAAAESAGTDPAAAPEPAEATAPSADAFPIAEDFEDEMATAVTADNYRAELESAMAEFDAE